jgi:hypothetical protein
MEEPKLPHEIVDIATFQVERSWTFPAALDFDRRR